MNNVEKPTNLELELLKYYDENKGGVSHESIMTRDDIIEYHIIFKPSHGSLQELQEISSKYGAQVNYVKGNKKMLEHVFQDDVPTFIKEGPYYEVFIINPNIGAKEQERRQTILNAAIQEAIDKKLY